MKTKERVLKFVIVGHVDHGKSTLIGRLLFDTNSLPPDKMEEVRQASKDLGRGTEFAFLLDHLKEEREQGITIDTAQTFFKTKEREYVIIDAPGHREFVKNMITGASQAEAALLIVDVDEGVQEQTRRHAYILAMLGLEQAIVLLNKMDLVEFKQEKFEQVKKETKGFLSSIGIEAKFYIPISAINGDNVAKKSDQMKWYQGPTTLESLDALENKISAQNKSLIFPVQDIYKVDEKRVIVGRVESGSIKKDQKVRILPSGEETGVASLEKFLEDTKKSVAGESTGITTTTPTFLERGSVICAVDGEEKLTNVFRANIFWMSKKKFDVSEKLILRCATQEVSCKISSIVRRLDSSTLEVLEENADTLNTLEVGEVLIKTKKPIVVRKFKDLEELGRFVLVRNENTCAGGIITEVSENGQ